MYGGADVQLHAPRHSTREKSPRLHLDGKLGGPHILSGCFGEEISCFCRESNILLDGPSRGLPTELYLSYTPSFTILTSLQVNNSKSVDYA
jgi:hypothetical protein